ncbi:GNAT family N-acetyltransferase [Pseudoalteromonas sp. T1lg65]|uniref:GNAT family N-acetyltransferase n=1 Tax=Pseudoalteromonas sp. T1lg65 TaxID=2077101 RepID=UPI003F7AF7BF
MKLNLYKATDDNKTYFWRHYHQAMHKHIKEIWGWDDAWQKDDFEQRWQQCENYLIQYHGEIVGFIQTVGIENEYYIMMLVILPEYQSRGIGADLIKALNTFCTQDFISLRVFRTNLNALKFYRIHGFSLVADEGDFFYLKKKRC